jgi:transporter family protein
LTAYLGKIGVTGINSNLATFIRTIVILFVTAAILFLRKEWRPISEVSGSTWTFLVLSGIATGLSCVVLLPGAAARAGKQGRTD